MAIFDVIKYNGDRNSLIWKYPNDELRLGTQVIVSEFQEAIFFRGGQALDVLGAGRHTLESANLPLLNKIVKLPFGGNSPFKAELYFINKAHVLAIKWGTSTPVQVQDPKYGIFVPVSAFGEFGISITDPKKFLMKLVGMQQSFDTEDLRDYFRGLYVSNVKDTISQYVIKQGVSILHLNAYLSDVAGFVKKKVEKVFKTYGVNVESLYINDIAVPENNPAVAKLKDALARHAEMNVVGYDYQQERSFDTLQQAFSSAASSGGSAMGTGMGTSMGLGVGFGLGGALGQQVGQLANSLNPMKQQTATPRTEQAVKWQPSFPEANGKPLAVVIRVLAQSGYVEANSENASKYTAAKQLVFNYKTDTGAPVFDVEDWVVSNVQMDDTNNILFNLTKKEVQQ